MSGLATSFVLGYHGCKLSVAEAIVNGKSELTQSQEKFDWLGPGAYFWESDPTRAWEWAAEKVKRKAYKEAAVLGAAIDLGNCLDLTKRRYLQMLSAAHDSFIEHQKVAGLPIPTNEPRNSTDPDNVYRNLDCAVIKHLHYMIAQDSEAQPFDTVRGLFIEGTPLYEGSGFRAKSHVQIAVLNPKQIKGIFLAKPEED